MKTYFILSAIFIACFVNSCSKSGSPAPTGTGTGVKTGTGTDTGTTETKPEFMLLLTNTNQTNLDLSGKVTSAGYTIVNLEKNTTRVISFGIGGNVRLELKNIVTGSLDYEGDDYTKVYYPKNVFKTGDNAPEISDTVSFACIKVTDPSAKDASTGHPVIKFIFLDNLGAAGDGGLGLVSDAKLAVMNGKALVKLYDRTDYKMNN